MCVRICGCQEHQSLLALVLRFREFRMTLDSLVEGGKGGKCTLGQQRFVDVAYIVVAVFVCFRHRVSCVARFLFSHLMRRVTFGIIDQRQSIRVGPQLIIRFVTQIIPIRTTLSHFMVRS